MSWNYASMSSAAKKAGGPEAYVRILMKSGRRAGHRDMIPWLGIAFMVGGFVSDLVRLLQENHKAEKKEVQIAKEKIIQGIKEYDEGNKEDADGEEPDCQHIGCSTSQEE